MQIISRMIISRMNMSKDMRSSPHALLNLSPNPLDAQCHGAPQLVLASVQNGILVRLGYSDYFHLSIYEYFDILCALSFFALSLLGTRFGPRLCAKRSGANFRV